MRHKKCFRYLSSGLTLGFAIHGWAAASVIDEIIVTAQKRSESTQDVPISISAFSAEKISAAGIKGTDDLQLVTPGLTVGRVTTSSVIFIRGIGTQDGSAGGEPSVATYVDGVYMVSPSANAFSFNNIERVEVLKGPQGTLFGRNATGGLIHIITKDPSHEPSINAEVSFDNYDTIETQFYGATGITDNIAADIAIRRSDQREGYGKNLATGNDVNLGEETALRSKLVFTPNDDLKLTFSADYSDSTSSYGIARQLAPGALGVDAVSTYTGNWQDYNGRMDPLIRVYRGGGSARIDYDAGAVNLVNISAYRKSNVSLAYNQDSTPAGLIDLNIRVLDEFFSNEIQLLSDTEGSFQWIVGGFLMAARSQYDPLGISGPAIGGNLGYFTSQDTLSYSVFAESTYWVTEQTSVTAGARWTHDERELEARHVFDGFTILDVAQEKSWSEPSWRLSLQHSLSDDVLLYGSYNRGFKSGVFSHLTPAEPAVNPEKIDAFEVGLKSRMLDGRVQANLAAFYYEYEDIQLTKAVQGALAIINAAAAEVQGVELNVDAALSSHVTARLGVSYVDGEYTEFEGGPIWTPNNVDGGNSESSGDLSGNDLIRSPDLTVTLGVSVAVPTAIGELGFDVNYYHSGAFAWEADNRLKQGAYSVINAEARWVSLDERWTLKLFGKNLSDEEYSNFSESTGVGDMITASPPRTYGLAIGYGF